MNAILEGLEPRFLQKVNILLKKLKEQDIYMVPISGLRSLEEQAKNWRKGRSLYEIQKKIYRLKKSHADYLADVIENVGPQNEPDRVTNAIPGLSWHNWGYALDCYVSYENNPKRLIFRKDDPLFQEYALPRYKAYADEAIKLGLTSGHYFKFMDMPHIQYFQEEVPRKYSLKHVNDYFKYLNKCSII
jgi:peptidoglycan L-alanyl-D-glutamate endopeptidase CwlK